MSTFLTLEAAEQFVMDSVIRMATHTVRVIEIDHAILAAGNEFSSRVKPIRDSGEVTTTEDEHELTVDLEGFLPRFMTRANVIEDGKPKPPLAYTNQTDIEERYKDGDEGEPKRITFKDTETALLEPIPKKEYPIRFQWWVPFVDFTPGEDGASDIELNIPVDMVYGVLWYGVPAYFHRGTEEMQVAQDARNRFEEHIQRCMGQTDQSAPGMIHVNENAY